MARLFTYQITNIMEITLYLNLILQSMTKFIAKRQKTALRQYGQVEDNIIIYIERLKT